MIVNVLLLVLLSIAPLNLVYIVKEIVRRANARANPDLLESHMHILIAVVFWVLFWLLVIPLIFQLRQKGVLLLRDIPILCFGLLCQLIAWIVAYRRVCVNVKTGRLDIYRWLHRKARVDDIVLIKNGHLGTYVYSSTRLLYFERIDADNSPGMYDYLLETSCCVVQRGNDYIPNESHPFLSLLKLEVPFTFQYEGMRYAVSFDEGCELYRVEGEQWALLCRCDTAAELMAKGQICDSLISEICDSFYCYNSSL